MECQHTRLITNLKSRFLALDRQYTASLLQNKVEDLIPICKELFADATPFLSDPAADPALSQLIYGVVTRIQVVSAGLARFERVAEDIGSEAQGKVHAICGNLGEPKQKNESDPYLPLRHWFLDHFSNPYPSIPEKEELMRQYPKHSKQQIDTWFTNIRRRSGWQELKKKYTNGTQEDFEKLIKATEREERTFMVEKCRVMIQEIKGFLRDGGRERVSDSIQEIVKKGAPATCTKRKIQARQSRGEGGGYRQVSSSSSSSQELPPLPFPFPSYPSTQMVDSPSSLYPTPLPSAPRHPSSFSSPTSSLRSVSDSSSSSIDSVLSYNSTSSYDTTPLHPMQTPSSPPAMSSLLSFNTPIRPLPSQESCQLQSRPLPPPVENPYFFTLNNTPLLPLISQPDPALASSSLAGFASNGDLLV